jgi:hypothetical protein
MIGVVALVVDVLTFEMVIKPSLSDEVESDIGKSFYITR